MILRSIRLVHFEGIENLALSDVPERGVVDVGALTGVDPAVVLDALRFAFFGGPADAARVISAGQGYAYVEAAFRVGRDVTASLFRGVDRRGSMQTSLREEAGMRVTGGAAEVRARLEELCGVPLDRFETATWIEAAAADAPPATSVVDEPIETAPRSIRRESDRAAVAEAVERAERSVGALRRALRAETLTARMDAAGAALAQFGARLRRERVDAAARADRIAGDRERVRARLRRVNEYRDLVVKARADAESRDVAAPPKRPAGAVAEWGLAACAVTLLLALVYVKATSARAPASQDDLAMLLGLGFLGSTACYVGVAAKRHRDGRFHVDALDDVRSAPTQDLREPWRDELAARYADLGDPDDPALVDDLRARLSSLDGEIEPAQQRLETVDEALAAFDAESDRVQREGGSAVEPADDGASGLAANEEIGDARACVARLSDAAYRASVERDALLAGGAQSVAAAAHDVREAFRLLGERTGDEARASAALDAAGLSPEAPVDVQALLRDDDVCLRLSDLAVEFGRAWTPPSDHDATPSRAAPPDPWPGGGEDAARLLADLVGPVAGREFVLVQIGGTIELRLQGPGDAAPVGWSTLPLDVRERLSLALRLRRADESSGSPRGPRHVVVSGRPATFTDDAALAEFVRLVVPGVEQVFARRDAADAGPTSSPR